MPDTVEVDRARNLLERNGYIVLKAASYRRAQERQRTAEALIENEKTATATAQAWARDCLTAERRLSARLTHVYGVARAHGATVNDLRQPEEADHG